MNKRIFAVPIVIALVGIAAAASAKTVTIRYVGEWGTNDDAMNKKLIAEFERRNPTIKVKYENATGGVAEKFTAQLAAGIAPDVIYVYDTWSATSAAKGLFLDLYPLLNQEKKLAKEFYPQALENFTTAKRELYALPTWQASSAMYYNKTIFDKSGVPYPNGTWSWDELVKYGKKMTIKGADGKITQWGYTPDGFSLNWSTGPTIWIWSNGGDLINSDMTKVLIGQPEAKLALSYYWDVIFKHGFAYTPTDQAKKNWWDRFIAGNIATWDCPSWSNTYISSGAKFPWDVAPTPKSPFTGKRSAFLHVRGSAISKGSKHKKEAWEFVKFMSSEEVQNMWAKDIGYQPTTKSSTDNWISEFRPNGLKIDLKIYSDSAREAKLLPVLTNAYKHGKFWEALNTEWDKVMSKKATVDEFINSVVPKAQAVLNLKMK